MSENKKVTDVINALAADTNNDAIKWERANDNEYTHTKEKYGTVTLARKATPQQKTSYTLIARKNQTEKMKANSQLGDDVATALEGLWKAVTEDYGDEGVKFLVGFLTPK